MQTEVANQLGVVAEHLQRLVAQFETLGARITFLARTLHLPLQTTAETRAALHCDGEAGTSGAHQREARMREELRGLLVLRYEMVAHLAADTSVGAQAVRDILLCANDRLLCKGFAPEAPGMNLRPLFEGVYD